uniref:Uncharacterized protein n=1 Tax=Anguilla anguilla TaxID=7936 RepID=A0A0E9PKH5_ANGAN
MQVSLVKKCLLNACKLNFSLERTKTFPLFMYVFLYIGHLCHTSGRDLSIRRHG